MNLKYFISCLLFFSFSIALANKKLPEYNRAECDTLIDAKQFIYKGSLDDPSPGGKTYLFENIVGSMSNELLGGQAPDIKRFDCLNAFFLKAKTDASQYWGDRANAEGCLASDSSVPKVKPEDCPQKTWDTFTSSIALIERSDVEMNNLTEKCVEKDGKKSCDARAQMQAIAEMAEPIAQSNSDKCCEKGSGAAFRVLRSFYTVEFGRLTDAELQKECYKRTRPNDSGALGTVASGTWQCVKSIFTGVLESLNKMLRTVTSLFDMAFWAEVGKILMNPSELPKKLMAFVQAMLGQISNQFTAMSDCFSGPYKADQACKLAASLATDFATPSFIVKYLIPALKGPVSAIGNMAKKFLNEHPNAKAKMEKIAAASKAVVDAPGKVVSATRSVVSSAARTAANRARAINQSYGSFKNKVKEVATKAKEAGVKARENAGQRLAGKDPDGNYRLNRTDKPETLNASTEVSATPSTTSATVVAATETTSATSVATSTVASTTTSTANSVARTAATPKYRTITKPQADKIIKDLNQKGLKDTYNAPKPNPETAFFTTDAKLRRASMDRRRTMLERGAERRRQEVARLQSNGVLTAQQADSYLTSINNTLAQAKKKYQIPDAPKSASVASTVVPENRPSTSNWPQEGNSLPKGNTPATAPEITPTPTVAVSTGTTGSTGGIIAAQADNVAATAATTVAEFKPLIQSPRLDSFVQSPVIPASKSALNSYNAVQNFAQNVQTAFASSGASLSPTAMRQAAYGGTNSYWSISRQTARQHNHVESLRASGQISPELAKDLHHMIESAERIASNLGRPTWYAGQRVVPPNTNPNMFTRIVTSKPVAIPATIGTGAAMSSKQYDRYVDGGTRESKYDNDTIKKSEIIVEKLASAPNAVKDEFKGLASEDAILDKADDLRMKIKVMEANLGKWRTEDEAKILSELLNAVQNERNQALARIGKPIPKNEVESTATIENGEASAQAEAAASADAAAGKGQPSVKPEPAPSRAPVQRAPAKKASPPPAATVEQPDSSGSTAPSQTDGDSEYEASP